MSQAIVRNLLIEFRTLGGADNILDLMRHAFVEGSRMSLYDGSGNALEYPYLRAQSDALKVAVELISGGSLREAKRIIWPLSVHVMDISPSEEQMADFANTLSGLNEAKSFTDLIESVFAYALKHNKNRPTAKLKFTHPLDDGLLNASEPMAVWKKLDALVRANLALVNAATDIPEGSVLEQIHKTNREMTPLKAVSQELISVRAEVIEMAVLQVENDTPETRDYVLSQLRLAHSAQIPAGDGFTAVQAMAMAGWAVRYNSEPDPDLTPEWNARTRWIMERTRAPYSFGDNLRLWTAPTFYSLVKIAKQHGYPPTHAVYRDQKGIQELLECLDDQLAQMTTSLHAEREEHNASAHAHTKNQGALEREVSKLREALELAAKAVPDFGGGSACVKFRNAYAAIKSDL